MAARVNGEFHLQETWVIKGSARSHQTRPLNLQGGNVHIRFSHSNGLVMMDLSTPGDGEVTNAANGQYEFTVSPAQQEDVGFQPGEYRYEVKVNLATGAYSVQNYGTIRVRPSLFAED